MLVVILKCFNLNSNSSMHERDPLFLKIGMNNLWLSTLFSILSTILFSVKLKKNICLILLYCGLEWVSVTSEEMRHLSI